MAYIKNRIIHRFIRDITEYLENGQSFGQVLPTDTQVYANYPVSANQIDADGNLKVGLYYVIGDGIHTYTEICNGYGENPYNKEYFSMPGTFAALGDIRIIDLKDGNILRFNKDLNAWLNVNIPPLPLNELLEDNEFFCGNASNIQQNIIDCGHAGTKPINYLDCGFISKVNYNIEFIKWI